MPDASPNAKRMLILAPRGRDAQTVHSVLRSADMPSLVCNSLTQLTRELGGGAGAAILTEEAIMGGEYMDLINWVANQPAWSDFPFILLVTSRAVPQCPQWEELAGMHQLLGNVILLERPLNAETLKRAAAVAWRGRTRQYQAYRVLEDRTRAEERLRMALQAGRMGAWELDLHSFILTASETCKNNFGRAAEESFSYLDFLHLVHPDDRDRHAATIAEAVRAGGDFDIEFRALWPDASIHWVQLRGEVSTRSRGMVKCISGISLDVTERVESAAELGASQNALRQLNDTLELRIHERTRELAQLNDRLMREINERERTQVALAQAQKMEAIGRLTGGIAHDFNNLLHVVSGNLDLMDRLTRDDRLKRFVATARNATQRGTKLTNQLLAFARNQNLDLKSVNLMQLADDMREILATSVGSRVQVIFEIEPDMPSAMADMNQIEMAILNLVINARDAMSDGGRLTVGIAVRAAQSADLEPGRYAVISVTDTGSGIRPEILGKVFEPFFTTKGVGQGTGLGLSQVYGVAQQSGGIARIESELGKGTRVEIWLPLAFDGADDSADFDDMPEQAFDTSAIRVMVVEDDEEVRQFMVESLEILGYSVMQAEDGMTGLAKMAIQRPDLLIVDFLMPGLNGAQVVSEVVAHDPDLPIIIATGYADMHAIDAIIGVNTVLKKPFQINELARTVKAALARTHH
jgi:PAS domain S-box-containing protein